MLPEYADYCYGEGNMHDTVMLLGLLGWDKYDGKGGVYHRAVRQLRYRPG